jgi:4-hydroxy-tetrahydrodipicolinate reductase
MSDQSADMRLVVVGAAGRMGQTLIRAIHSIPGASVAAAIERKGSPQVGQDAGQLAGVGTLGVKISDDPLPAFAKADGVLDFTMPAASVEFAGYAAQARIVHVIGTTGCSAEDDARIAAAARHATIVKSGNMSLGVNLLAVLVEQAAKALGPEDFDIEILEMHHRHKVDAPSGTALLLGEAAARGREIAPRCVAAPSSATTASSLPAPASASRYRTTPRTAPSSRAARSGRRSGRAARRPGSIRCATCSASALHKFHNLTRP